MNPDQYLAAGLLAALVVIFAMAVGHAIGQQMEAAYWRGKADDTYGRTAVCSDGRFFCVLPESEYSELVRLKYAALSTETDDYPQSTE